MDNKIQLPTLKKVDPNKPKKKKILLLSDDLRLHSGIATQSKELVLSTLDKYDWVQLGAALKHPDQGKVFDISVDAGKEAGVDDAYLKVYANTGYGNPEILRELINIEKPDAILHFTDPRFWKWLYDMEMEVRQIVPIMYYNIWDSLPDPMWNAPFYASCDLLISISKQTYGINKRTLEKYNMPKEDWAYKYIPHGVSKYFKPISSDSQSLIDFKTKNGLNEYDFVVLWNNRNIRRKVPGDVILAFNEFAKRHEDKKVCLLMHTQQVDENGTDIPAIIKHNTTHGDYKFTNGHMTTEELNLYYNSGDVILNIASNEGFGLASCEALRAGTPIIVNVTGGLQDQCGFDFEGDELTADDYVKLGSLHDRREWSKNEALGHGNWVYPVWPSNRSLQGSPQTPFIFDDRCDFIEVAEQLGNALRDGRDHLEVVGNYGSEWVQGESGMASETMGDKFIDAIDGCLKNWTPRKRFEIYTT
jgi:glycosyltransferase involved in cell wall biosynthesis|tara:strand:+ start:16749 stop:18170 length:1422 start_codon:yes stop_codon:yes gene_type:complete